MKLWDVTIYLILSIHLIDKYMQTGSIGYLLIHAGLVIAFFTKNPEIWRKGEGRDLGD